MADDCVPKVTPGENEAFLRSLGLSLSLARGVIGLKGALQRPGSFRRARSHTSDEAAFEEQLAKRPATGIRTCELRADLFPGSRVETRNACVSNFRFLLAAERAFLSAIREESPPENREQRTHTRARAQRE